MDCARPRDHLVTYGRRAVNPELPSEADIEYLAMQRRSSLTRDDGRPILVGRDTPSQEELAEAEASGTLWDAPQSPRVEIVNITSEAL